MDDKSLDSRVIRLEYGQHAVNKRLDAHEDRFDRIEPTLEDIGNTLKKIMWVSTGILFGVAFAATDFDAVIKVMKAIL